jgi:hypothetical protein
LARFPAVTMGDDHRVHRYDDDRPVDLSALEELEVFLVGEGRARLSLRRATDCL